MQTISLAEIGTVAAAMLEDALRQMRSHPHVHRAAITVSHDVDPTAAMLPIHLREKNTSGAPGQARGDGRRMAPSPAFLPFTASMADTKARRLSSPLALRKERKSVV